MRLRRFTAISTVLTIVSLFFALPSPSEQRLYQQITRQTAVCSQISDVLKLGRDGRAGTIRPVMFTTKE
jgi:hypothetical protein